VRCAPRRWRGLAAPRPVRLGVFERGVPGPCAVNPRVRRRLRCLPRRRRRPHCHLPKATGTRPSCRGKGWRCSNSCPGRLPCDRARSRPSCRTTAGTSPRRARNARPNSFHPRCNGVRKRHSGWGRAEGRRRHPRKRSGLPGNRRSRTYLRGSVASRRRGGGSGHSGLGWCWCWCFDAEGSSQRLREGYFDVEGSSQRLREGYFDAEGSSQRLRGCNRIRRSHARLGCHARVPWEHGPAMGAARRHDVDRYP